MSSTQRLELRQGQSLTMTPQLLQSIKLLQLSHLDLATFIDAELERNPLLQEAEDVTQPTSPDARAQASRTAERLIRRVFPQTGARHPQGLAATKAAPSGGSLSGATSDLDATLAGQPTLTDHLESQLDLSTADPNLRAAGRHVIHSLNEAGYLVDEVDEIAASLGISRDIVAAALAMVQSFDPSGIGARDLCECLGIQLRERDRLDAAMETLLSRLDLVAKGDHASLRRFCGVTQETLADMLAELRSLDPRPGLAFGGGTADVLIPDVFVRATPDGSFSVELNGATMPRLLVDRSYHAQIVGSVRNETDQVFLSECFKSAQWLARSLDQRASTIAKVAAEIVRQQSAFLRMGPAHLRPMTLKSVAEAVGLHESTISRVTANKALGTPRGTYLMKYFFSSALPDSSGTEVHSSEAVRHRIRALIAGESEGKVLSDDAIARHLRASGIGIARRTVAKYRESLRIPASAQRRRLSKRATAPPQ